jgi:hypothetical protein
MAAGFGSAATVVRHRAERTVVPPLRDLVHETFVVAPVSALLFLRDERTWSRWFPRLALTCTQDRGRLGKRWTVDGELSGTAEVWLQEHADGVIVHLYLRPRGQGAGSGRRLSHYSSEMRARMFEVKDELEAGRSAGEPRPWGSASSVRGVAGDRGGGSDDA